MIFSAPLFLYLLPAAGLPVLFHLLLKQKKRQILFPTLMFFYRTDPRLHARRRLHEWLLLLMRVLLILCLVLALTRPHFQSAVPVGGKLSMVAVVDNSGSMSDRAGDDQTKLQWAVLGAKHLISSLGQQARMNVVTLVGDPNVPVGSSLISDKDLLLGTLDKIAPTAATGNMDRALTQALTLLKADSGSGGVIHVFSDLQASEWLDSDLQLDVTDPGVRIYLHRVATQPREQANVAISSLQFPPQVILPQHPLTVGVVCRNLSQVSASIRVNSVDNQDVKQSQHLVMDPGATQIVQISTRPERAGTHWVRAWIEGDGFSADNEAGIGIMCRETATVAFNGSQREFGVLPTAFSPDDYGQFTGMVSRFGRTTESAHKGAPLPILIVTTWADIQRTGNSAADLRDYVQGGGNLLVVPGLSAVRPTDPSPDWLGAGLGSRLSFARGAPLEAFSTESDFWHRIRAVAGDASMDNARAFTFYALSLTEGFTPLLGTSHEQIVLARKTLGLGHIYASGTAFDLRWNTLPLTGLMVVMAQGMAVQANAVEQEAMLTLVAGETLTGLNAGPHEVEIHTLVGQTMDWTGPASDMPVFTQPGAYRLKTGDRIIAVSVCSSSREGLMQFVDGTSIPGLNSVTHEIVNFDPDDAFEQYHQGLSRTFNLFLPLILMATAAMLVEGWLAHPVRAGSARVTPFQRASAVVQSDSVLRTLDTEAQTVPALREGE